MSDYNINKKIISGVVWKFAERFVAQGVSFFVSLILARILMPADYGVVAIINIFITIADIFLSSGLNTSLIQKKEVTDLEFSTIFWCNLGLGCVLYLVMFIAAPFISRAYNMPILILAIRVFALRLPISSFQSIQTAFVSRKMDFKKFFWATIVGTLISAVVGIGMALNGFGVWALIAQYMANTIIDTIFLFFTVKWYPKFVFSWKAAKPLIRYGSRVMITDMIGTVSNNLTDFIIGLHYKPSDLAFYSKGRQLPSLIKTNIYSSLLSVLFSGMSRVSDTGESIKDISRRSIETLSFILYPMMIGLIVVATPLTTVLYTEKWLSMVPYIRIVCVEVILSVPGTIALQSIKAVGRSDLMLKAEFIKKPILLLCVIISLKYGVIALALTLPVNTLIEFLINSYLTHKCIAYSLIEQIKDISSALVMSLVMGICVFSISKVVSGQYIVLGIQVILGVIIYIVLSIILKNRVYMMIKRSILSKIHKAK